MTADAPSLTLIVPAFNESRRIPSSLRKIDAYLSARGESCEIVVVDDGSDDGTADVVSNVARDLQTPLRVMRYPDNRGKGYAIKAGFAAARGQRILFTDADLSTPIEEASRLLAALDEADVAIGTRRSPESRILVHQPWYREKMGATFTFIVRQLVVDVSDATCGFKAFRGDVGRDLFARTRIYDWSFDAELLWLARRRGYSIREVAVRWEDQAGTKVSLLRDTVGALVGIFRIRLNGLLDRYAEPYTSGSPPETWPGGSADP